MDWLSHYELAFWLSAGSLLLAAIGVLLLQGVRPLAQCASDLQHSERSPLERG